MNALLRLLRRPLAHVALLSFCANLLLLAPALFMLQVFDRVLASHSRETLGVLLLGTAIALGLLFTIDYLRGRLQGVVGATVAQALSPAVARVMVAQGARRGGQTPTEGLRDVATLRMLFSAQALLALFDAPWALVYVGVIWLAHPTLGMAALGAVALMLALALATHLLTRNAVDRMQKASAGATRYLEASLRNAEVAQTLGMTGALIDRWRERDAQAAMLHEPTARRSMAMAAATRTVRQALQVVMMAVAAWLVIGAEATPGVMIAATLLLGRALAPVEQVVGSWRVLADARGAYRRLAELLGAADAAPPRMPLPAPAGMLEAHNLMFRAPGSDRLLIAGVSLALQPGEALAIIGPSGAGKSTLVRLLTGLWQPQAGSVRLDGADLAQWPRERIGPWIGYVPQDVELFPGTVAANIARLGAIDHEQVVTAAQRAGAHALILGLPQGYDTVVDPDATMLSPGQRQRIALARALYGDPRLLVLDEPNSNLDTEGEHALVAALSALRGQVTMVVVTHRATLTRCVDRVLMLEAGRVRHLGPTDQVLQALRTPAAAPATVAATNRRHPLAASLAGSLGAALADARRPRTPSAPASTAARSAVADAVPSELGAA